MCNEGAFTRRRLGRDTMSDRAHGTSSSHHRFVFVLDGELEISACDLSEDATLAAGDFAYFPPGCAHK